MAAKKKTKRIPRTQRVDEMTDLILDIFWSHHIPWEIKSS
jgi:hypothetical protein